MTFSEIYWAYVDGVKSQGEVIQLIDSEILNGGLSVDSELVLNISLGRDLGPEKFKEILYVLSQKDEIDKRFEILSTRCGDDALFQAIVGFDCNYKLSIIKNIEEYDGKFLGYVWIPEEISKINTVEKGYDSNSEMRIIKMCECLIRHEDDRVRTFAVIGIIEGVQNRGGRGELDMYRFYEKLSPLAQLSWNRVNEFWRGEVNPIPDPLVDYKNNGLVDKI